MQHSGRLSRILGLGAYLPPRRVTNDDLAKMFDTSDEWIQQRTGIKERRYADEGVFCSDLALEATKEALKDSNVALEEIDYIILATLSPDFHFPGTACYLQKKLGLPKVPCLDIRQQCTGFLYGLSIADAYIKAGLYRRILLVGAEVHSSALNFTSEGRDVAVLFGDGAGAAVIGPSDDPSRGLLTMHLHADGNFADILMLEIFNISKKPYITHGSLDEGRQFPKMIGRDVFRVAVTRMPEVIKEALQSAGIGLNDIKLFIPHQANMRINQFVAASLNLPEEKFFHNIQRYGNTTAASIPIALKEARDEGLFEEGDLITLVAFGAGFTWGAGILRW